MSSASRKRLVLVGVVLVSGLGLALAFGRPLGGDTSSPTTVPRSPGAPPVAASVSSPLASTPATLSATPQQDSATKDAKPAKVEPKPKPSVPVPSEPPNDPAVSPPADTPVDAPVGPPVDPPSAPGAPGGIPRVVCTSGDMVDVIVFDAPVGGGPIDGYVLSSSLSMDGPYSVVATVGVEAHSFTHTVSNTALSYYTVTATGPSGAGPASTPVVNAHVSLTAEVPPQGRTLRASNGEIVLTLPAGSFTETTTVTIEEVTGSAVGGIIALAGVYDIEPSGSLGARATLSIAYTLAVTHFEVSETLLRAAALLTYDASAGAWASEATGIRAEGGFISGEVDHFSVWTPGSPSPHGTDAEAANYCSGICHDLTTYPGSALRYGSRDPQICYNCHGSSDPTSLPNCQVGPNVQAELYAIAGQVTPPTASRHPVVLGGLYCTACHDPHAAKSSSPGLLRAWNPVTGGLVQGGSGASPGTEFCWTCHGTAKNRRIDYIVPGYYTRTGGDKKTRFTGGAHTAGAAQTQRLDTQAELQRGIATRVQVDAGGTVTLPVASIELPKLGNPVMLPTPSGRFPTQSSDRILYDGDNVGRVYWTPAGAGATAGNGWVGNVWVTVDLGCQTKVDSFTFRTWQYATAGTYAADKVEILVSSDNIAWTSIATQGTTGTRLSDVVTLTGTAECRYVRFHATRLFVAGAGELDITELTVHGQPLAGTFEMRVDIPRKATYTGGTVRWQATTPAETSLAFAARASLNNGTTWTAWQPLTNGSSLTVIPNGSSLDSALLEVSGAFGSTVFGQTPSLDWLEVTTTRGTIAGSPPAWTGEPLLNECQRCHIPHGSPDPGLVNAASTVACTTCHATAYGGTYFGPAEFAASEHSAVRCTGCHGSHGTASGPNGIFGFLLPDTRQDACFSCHPAVKEAFESDQGPASEYAKHDIFAPEQAKTTSRMSCNNCHSAHSSSGLVNPDSINTPYTAYRDDPTSIPTQEIVIYSSKDTILDQANPTWNYGSASSDTLTSTKRLLTYFDLSAIPAGATIQHAELVIYTTSTSGTGGYVAYPMSRDWLEGSGLGAVNDATKNGASWLEWKFDDNVNAGNVVAGDWAVSGGDRSASAIGSVPRIDSGNATNITGSMNALRAGSFYGLMIAPLDAGTSFVTYTREIGTVKYRPKLRIVYQTGPATRQVIDDVTFCLKCHDGNLPLGLRGQSILNIASNYGFKVHGGGEGFGPESNSANKDAGGGGLKAPYTYGMAALPCTTCHDPHGSRLPFHLKEVVNGRDMSRAWDPQWGYSNVIRSAMGMSSIPDAGWFCGACHIFPSNHNMENSSGCAPCHNHSGSRG